MTAHGGQEPLTHLSSVPASPSPVLFVLVGALAAAAVVFGRSEPDLVLVVLALLVATAAVWLFFQPRIAVLLLVLYVPTQFWLIDELGLLPGRLRFLDDFLFGLLAARVLADRLRRGAPLVTTKWDLPILLFLGVGVLSALLNDVPWTNAVAGLRAPLLYCLLLYIILNLPEQLDSRFLDWIWRVLLWLALLQPLAAIYQYPLRGFRADALTGTLGPGGANDLGVFLLPFLFYLVSLRFDGARPPRWALPGILVLAATTILCGSRAAWFISLGTILLLWGRRLLRPRTLVLVTAAAALLYLILDRVVFFQGAHSIGHAVGWKTIYAALFLISSGGGSLAYVPVVWRLLLSTGAAPLFGLGPGMVSSTAAVHLQAPLYNNVLYDYFGQTLIGLDGGVESQLIATGSELGPLGLIAGFSLVILWLLEARRARLDSRSDHERALATGLFAAALGAILLTPIRNIWETPHLALSLWLPGAVLLARRLRRG